MDMSIAAGISATKTGFDLIGFDLIKSLRDTLGRPDVNPGDIQARLVELQSLMLDAQRAMSDAEEENRKLRAEISANDRLKEISDDLEFADDGKFYVKKSEKAQGRDIPYCPICWGRDQKLVPLIPYCNPGRFKCVLHQSEYGTAKFYDWNKERLERERRRAATQPTS